MSDLKLIHKLVDEGNERLSKGMSTTGVLEIKMTQISGGSGYYAPYAQHYL